MLLHSWLRYWKGRRRGGKLPTCPHGHRRAPARVVAGYRPRLEALEDRCCPSGTYALVYSTYLGGSNGNDIATGIAVGSAGNAYVTGYTNSTNFPTKNPFQGTFAGNLDAL